MPLLDLCYVAKVGWLRTRSVCSVVWGLSWALVPLGRAGVPSISMWPGQHRASELHPASTGCHLLCAEHCAGAREISPPLALPWPHRGRATEAGFTCSQRSSLWHSCPCLPYLSMLVSYGLLKMLDITLHVGNATF